uniref:Trafficking protein particle complex subunit 6B n=1 Tax=Talaromyces marneffei PM1 TaxID=1077442 RepID=A0A093X9Q3_TALMA
MSLDSQNPFNPSDPHARFVSTSCLDLLLIEIVPMAERITQDLLVNSTTTDGTNNAVAKIEDEELQEATFYRLEMLGYRVGQGLAERKQVDNLKTNHRGVYVLSDNAFRPLTRMSMAVRSEAVARAEAFLWFPCGLIRGCLASLGIDATVQAETSELPGATFQIKSNQAKT